MQMCKPTYVRTCIGTYAHAHTYALIPIHNRHLDEHMRTYLRKGMHSYNVHTLHTLHEHMHTVIHTGRRTEHLPYLPTYIPTYLPTYIHMCMHACMHAHVHCFMNACMRTYIDT